MLTQLAEAVTDLFGLNYYPGRVGWWVAGSNRNKADLSPAGAGARLSLAKNVSLPYAHLLFNNPQFL